MSKMIQQLDSDEIEEAIKKYVRERPYFFIEGRRIVDVEIKVDKRTKAVTALVETDVRSSLEVPIETPLSFDNKLYDILKEKEGSGSVSKVLSIQFDDEDDIDDSEEE